MAKRRTLYGHADYFVGLRRLKLRGIDIFLLSNEIWSLLETTETNELLQMVEYVDGRPNRLELYIDHCSVTFEFVDHNFDQVLLLSIE